ncbi:uncharacterized protein LOC121738073 [Aricia agestis]|uniref:uncharacterized protein LOC121738073 n=1 Tax=Aricia agestis TaxID=91739 RepID=UPI001C2081CE|nr:uncharacterized protein LOC121738073 [Aricia agestis]
MLFLLLFLPCTEAVLRVIVADTPVRRIGSKLYKEELLTDEYKDAKELAYDSASRNLYFMYMDDSIQNSGRAYVNVITKKSSKIYGIEKNKATAVDHESGDVYFGSENGLYKYDPIENLASNIGLFNINIFKIIIRSNAMYYIDADNHTIYKVLNNGKGTVKVANVDSVMEFEVDFENRIHFVTMDGVFCLKNGEIIKNNDINIVYHYISDELKTFGVSDDGLYEVYCNGTAKRVADLDFFPKSIIFGDYGDIFYSSDNKIYRLKPIHKYTVYNIHRNTL